MSIKRIIIILLLIVICGVGIIYYLGTCSSRCMPPSGLIKVYLKSIQEEAKKIYSINKNYAGFCTHPVVIKYTSGASAKLEGYILKSKVNNSLDASGGPRLVSCHLAQDNNSWVVASPLLKKEKAYSWCVDSTGASKRISGYLVANATVCP